MLEIKILTSFLLSLVFGLITIPLILKFCKERNLYDIPDFRKRHKQAIPRLGGIAFLPCMLLSFGLVLLIFSIKYTAATSVHLWYLYLLFGFLIIYVVGIFDDIVSLSARLKFFVQFLAACCLPAAGIYISNLFGLFGVYEIPSYVGIPLTIGTILLIVNAINLIDGIDGLSASISVICLCGYIYLYSAINAWVICVMCSGLIGSLIAFLYFNMFGKPEKNTKIFMGDSGSLTLGFIIAAMFVKFLMLAFENGATENNKGVVLAYSLLIIPVYDVFRVVIIRLRNKKPLFGADRNHIHHKLMDAGFSPYWTLGIIVSFALVYIICNLILEDYYSNTTIFMIDVIAYILFNYAIRLKQRK